MKTILLIPTICCNLRCEICHFNVKKCDIGYSFNGYGKTKEIIKEIEWQEWIAYLDRFRPYHLEFTGGEPTLYEGFFELINHLPADAQWAITSNTLSPKLSEINLKQCKHWTASYHAEGNRQLFIENINYLKDKTPLSISIVVEYNKFDKCLEDAEYFKRKGYKVNLLKELNQGIVWENTNKWNILFSMKYKGYNVIEDDIPMEYKFEKGFSCLAGMNYFCAMPDGMIYECFTSAMHGEPMGHIKDVSLYLSVHDCFIECLACAIDHKFRVRKLKEVYA